MRAAVTVVLAVLLAATATSAAPRVRISKPPANLRAGETWLALVRNAPAGARFAIRGPVARTFPLRRDSAGLGALVVFPRSGTWAYGISVRKGFTRVGTVVVRPRLRALVVHEPFDAVDAGRWILISDRIDNALYRLERATREWSRLARITEARDVEVVDDRTVLVTSTSEVLRVDVQTPATTTVARAADVIVGLVRAANGDLYVSEGGTRLVRIAGDGSRRVILDGRNGIHGLLFAGGRLIACETFAGNVLSVDIDTGAVQVLARGLANPSYAAPAPNGFYITEFQGNRIDLLARDGAVRPIAEMPYPGSLFPSSGGTLLATSVVTDAVVRVDPASGSVTSILPS
jgi:hypothetical protein